MKTKFDDLMASFNRVVSFRDGTESQQKAISTFKEELTTALKDIRNTTLEEAALKCNQLDFSYSMCEQYRDGSVACECAEEIRKLKS